MTHEPDVPALTSDCSTTSLRQPASADKVQHRNWIGGAIKLLLSFYWQERDPSELLEREVLRAWMDDLEIFPRDVIMAAIRHWRRTETKRPTPAALIKLCCAEMPKSKPAPPTEPERPQPTPEEVANIQRQVDELERMANAQSGPPRNGGPSYRH